MSSFEKFFLTQNALKEVDKDVLNCSQFLEKLPYKNLFLIKCDNSLNTLYFYFLCIKHGHTSILCNNLNEEINYIEKYTPNYIFSCYIDKSNDSENSTKVLRLGPNHFLKHHYEKKIKLKNELALLLPTSGSTGSSKLVRISYSNLIENARSIVKYLNINKDDVAISSLPMHYSFGLSIINSHLLMGAKIVMTDKSIMEKDFWELVKTHKVTSLSGVPYSFEMLKRLRFFTMQLPHLRMLTQAGGKLDNKLQLQFAEYCKENNKEFFVMYGQTEATARMSYLPSEMAIEKIGSIGIPIPGGEFVLINEHGEIINQPNVPGELVYRGPNVSMGYAESVEDLSKGDENIGVLYTGDIVYRDEDGYYFIVGRKNRFLKLFGNRVSLDEVEQHLKELGIESICAGVDDKLIVYTTQDYQEKEIKENLAKLTSIHFSAFKVVHIDEIPRNSAGKIIYAQLPIE